MDPCSNCKYFIPSKDPDEEDYGYCHRFPPQTLKHHTDWCGEFVTVFKSPVIAPGLLNEIGVSKG